MESRETKTALEEKTIAQSDDGMLHVLPSNTSEVRHSKVYRVKGVVRSLTVDSLKVLDDMWEDCQTSPELVEKYCLLRHYLNYLKQFSEGRA